MKAIHALVLVLLVFMGASQASAQLASSMLSPFEGVRWNEQGTEVKIDGKWYRFKAIDSVPLDALLDESRSAFGDDWKIGFEEKVVTLLTNLGQSPGVYVGLELEDIETGDRIVKGHVQMSTNKRQLAQIYRRKATRLKLLEKAKNQRVQRDHMEIEPDSEYWFMGDRPRPGRRDAVGANVIRSPTPTRDLEQFEWLIENRWALFGYKPFDYQRMADSIRWRTAGKLTIRDFQLQIARLIVYLGDSQAVVGRWTRLLPPAHLPFLIEQTESGRFVAFKTDRSGFLDDEHPFITALDDESVEYWLNVAARITPHTSKAGQRRSAIRNMRYFIYLRSENEKVGNANPIKITLESDQGDAITIKRDLTPRKPIYGWWPKPVEPKVLDGNTGYIRLATMNNKSGLFDMIHKSMAVSRETQGLIIDLRGNVGGSRDALAALYPYLVDSSSAPRVVSVSRPMLDEDSNPRDLSNLYLYEQADPRLNRMEQAVAESFLKTFTPAFEPVKPENFSPLYVSVLSASEDPAVFHYEHPIIVLMDSSCDTGTSVLLSAIKGMDNITLMGTHARGGTDLVDSHTLAFSNTEVFIPAMITYNTDGSVLSGEGVEPDVFAGQVATDILGKTDTVLDRALDLLKEQRSASRP